MSPLALAALWLVVAAVAVPAVGASGPVRAVLIAAGVPLLGWLTWAHGPMTGLLALGAGVAMLRWPPAEIVAWLRRDRDPSER
ncbi:DUF2484 family protein [Rhodobaculum claviforme]|uniref:DUF2484 family protein n=1 Tax=Rhodobaculum claviforme TaxID=1549854 RepID=A0A934WI96_9RHOB|nr:hypothetical protein [Rhodobaculum claviforme]